MGCAGLNFVPAQTFLSVRQMPKAVSIVEEEEVIEEPTEEQAVPEELVEEEVAVPKPKAKARKDAPASTKKKKTDLTTKHTCGGCGKTMSLHTAMYGHKNCPGETSIPQPPLVRQTAIEPPPEPQVSQAQLLRYHLANAAQERRAQAHLRVVGPIRQFYGL
jgi:hypothetical protein